MYRYIHNASYCSSGGIIRSFIARWDNVQNPDAFTNVQEIVTNQRGSVGVSQTWSMMKRHITTDVPPFGTYNHHYPWVKLVLGPADILSHTGASQ